MAYHTKQIRRQYNMYTVLNSLGIEYTVRNSENMYVLEFYSTQLLIRLLAFTLMVESCHVTRFLPGLDQL